MLVGERPHGGDDPGRVAAHGLHVTEDDLAALLRQVPFQQPDPVSGNRDEQRLASGQAGPGETQDLGEVLRLVAVEKRHVPQAVVGSISHGGIGRSRRDTR